MCATHSALKCTLRTLIDLLHKEYGILSRFQTYDVVLLPQSDASVSKPQYLTLPEHILFCVFFDNGIDQKIFS